MAELERAVGHFVGPYFNGNTVHPYGRDDIYECMEEYQRGFNDMGLDFVVPVLAESPRGPRELGDVPEVRFIRDPKFRNGELVEGRLCEGDLAALPGILDHCVVMFHGESTRYPDLNNRQAFGLGLPLERSWNPYPIQDMGNHKDRMQEALDHVGAGIPTHYARELEQFEAEHGDIPLAFKPLGGANGHGMAEFADLAEAKKALDRGEIDPNGLIQPYLDFTHPVPELVPYDANAAEQLRLLNSDNTRQREVRMHVIADRGSSGELTVDAYPTLRVGAPGRRFIGDSTYIALDKDSMGPGHPMYDTSVVATETIAQAAEFYSGETVPHFYGTLDFMYDGERSYIGDANSRGPRVPEASHAARKGLIAHIGSKALLELDRVG